jgi:hypothetical protein
MQCRADRDGLMGTTYIHEGELFEAEKCPSWATAVNPPEDPKKKTGGATAPRKPGEK